MYKKNHCVFVGWFVGFPQNLNGGRISAQNRPKLTFGVDPDRGDVSGIFFALSLFFNTFVNLSGNGHGS